MDLLCCIACIFISTSHCSLSISSAKVCDLLLDPYHGAVHQTGRYYGDRAIYTCGGGYQIIGPEERVCQATGLWSSQEPYCKKKGEQRYS